jgi:hypothetical protein
LAKKTLSARARVQMTIEIDAGSNWGNDCTAEQLYSQAGRESLNHVRNIFQKAEERP